MKIRTGFVSNSSSASFMVTVGMPLDEFLGIIHNHAGARNLHLNPDRLKKWMEAWSGGCSSAGIPVPDICLRIQETLDKDEKVTKEMIGEALLVREGVEMEDRADFGICQLTWMTTMHNDFRSSIPDVLKEFLLENLFENRYNLPLVCRIDN